MRKYCIKKLLALGLVICLFISTGCELMNKSKKVIGVSTDAFQEKRLSQAALTFYLPGSEPQEYKKVKAGIEEALKDSLNVKITFKWYNKDTFMQEIQTAFKDRRTFDAVVIPTDQYGKEIDTMQRNNQVLDLTELLPKVAPKLYNLYSKEELAAGTYDNKLITIPSKVSSYPRICAVIRDDIMKKYNIPDIKTYEDYERFLGIVKRGEDSMHPLALTKNTLELFAEENGYIHLGDNIVYKGDDKGLKLIPWEQTPAFRYAVETLNKWHDNGYIYNYSPFPILYSGVTPPGFLSEGITVSYLTSWDEAQYDTRFIGFGGTKVRIYPLSMDKIENRNPGTVGIMINKDSKNPDRVLRLLEWIQEKQVNNDFFMYGIKDKNYVLKGEEVDFPANVSKFFGWDGTTAFTSDKYLYNQKGDINNYKKLSENLMTNSKFAPTMGFRANKEKIQGLIDQRNKNFEEMQRLITEGQFNNSTDIDNFIEKQKSLGVDSIAAELQKQLDEWKSSAN